MPTPSMDDKKTPSPPDRQDWQYQADKILGFNSRPWPTDEQRRQALISAGLSHWLPQPRRRRMPPKSEAQRRAMQAAAHGKSTLGIPAKVGKEFAAADKGGKLPKRMPKQGRSG